MVHTEIKLYQPLPTQILSPGFTENQSSKWPITLSHLTEQLQNTLQNIPGITSFPGRMIQKLTEGTKKFLSLFQLQIPAICTSRFGTGPPCKSRCVLVHITNITTTSPQLQLASSLDCMFFIWEIHPKGHQDMLRCTHLNTSNLSQNFP